MARTTTKSATKTATKATPAKKAVKKPAVKKAPAKPAAPSVDDRVKRLEEKLSTLIAVLHHNYAKDLVKGPKDLASKIRKNGLLE